MRIGVGLCVAKFLVSLQGALEELDRSPPEIISHAVWLYHRFTLSFREVEDLLDERTIIVSSESIRKRCCKFSPAYARTLKRKQGRLGDLWFRDELFIAIQGKRHDLWRPVDQEGDTMDILVRRSSDCRAAKRFCHKALKGQGWTPPRLVTDKLRSYSAAHRVVFTLAPHSTQQYENNRTEVSHQSTRQQERRMRRFKSGAQAQRFQSVHAAVYNLFRCGRHLLRAANHRFLRDRAFDFWHQVTCAL